MTDKDKKVDVDFNEALRRIAHTPKSLIDNDKDKQAKVVPPFQGGTDKVKNEKS